MNVHPVLQTGSGSFIYGDEVKYTDIFVVETEKLQSNVTSANEETEEALRELSDCKETVTSPECQLNVVRDVERMYNEHVTDSNILINTISSDIFVPVGS